MRKIRIPQKPDRPDIDDLILATSMRRKAISKTTYRFCPRRACREMQIKPRGFFIFIS